MFRNLIFDWSGTLVDDLGPVLEATNAVFAAYGRGPMSRAQFRQHFRLPYLEFYHEFLPGVPIERLETVFRAAFAASSVPVKVLPHVREKLAWCRARGIRAFVLTSMDVAAFGRQLEQFALTAAFEATYAGVVDKRRMIGEILERHRLAQRDRALRPPGRDAVRLPLPEGRTALRPAQRTEGAPLPGDREKAREAGAGAGGRPDSREDLEAGRGEPDA